MPVTRPATLAARLSRPPDATDADLLARYARERDGSAFAEFQDAEKGVLRKILADRPVPGQVHEIARKGGVVTVEQNFEASHITRPDFTHYGFVVQCHFFLHPGIPRGGEKVTEERSQKSEARIKPGSRTGIGP